MGAAFFSFPVLFSLTRLPYPSRKYYSPASPMLSRNIHPRTAGMRHARTDALFASAAV